MKIFGAALTAAVMATGWSSTPTTMMFASAQDLSNVPPVVQIHGSGTTNPSKCYWHIMDQLEEQMKLPAKLSYRAVGSGNGQTEFIGSGVLPDNDFGSGDIPLSSDQFDVLAGQNIGIVHLPVLLGAITFFHSMPVPKLNLSPCLIAKIFKREVTDWSDQLVVDENPGIVDQLPGGSLAISIARRGDGSSSTQSITSFLNIACSDEWPLTKVGKNPEDVQWPEGETMDCRGSSGMTTCIRETPGTLGYSDAGHGHSEGLAEIELKNADGTFLTSITANENNGILAAAEATGTNIPDSLDEDFGNVQLLNKPGQYTWPIVALSYVYVRKDLPSFIPNPVNQQMLKAFLNALYMDEYINDCDDKFAFTPITGPLRVKAQAAIQDMLISDATAEEAFQFEDGTADPRTGQGPFVISSKRDTYAAVEQRAIAASVANLETMAESNSAGGGEGSTVSSDLDAKVAALEQSNAQLQTAVNALRSELDALKSVVGNGDTASSGGSPSDANAFGNSQQSEHEHEHEFTEDDETKLEAALALAIIAFVFWMVAIILGLAKMCGLF